MPLRVIKMGSTKAYSFEEWYGASIPEQHMRAIESAATFTSFTSTRFPTAGRWAYVRL